MQIRRDHTRPLFSNRRHGNGRLLFVFGLILGGLLVLISLYFNQLQLVALDAVGMAPTATPVASEYAARGMEAFQAGDVEQAVTMFRNAVRQKPENVDYLYEYGRLLIEVEQSDEAVAIADRAVEVDPNDPRGYALKAQALMWDDPDTAIQISYQGIDVDPNFAPLYAAAGVAYLNKARWSEALRNAQRAVELDPSDIFVQRAYQYPLIYVGQYQEAINALKAAISLNENLPGPYFELAYLYTIPRVNDFGMAIGIYNHIIEMEPDNAKAYLRLCETYARMENARFDVAQPYCDQAIEIDPEYAAAYRQRGQMQYARRNYEGSIESFEKCIEYGSTEIECWYLRGWAHYFLGNCDEAWQVLQESSTMAAEQNSSPDVVDRIDIGLFNITVNCSGYDDLPTPTPIPPTPIPATPIGGFG